MNCSPHWTAYLSALMTPVVAIIGAWIAYQQWKVGRGKLRLDLFDRRLKVYDGAKALLVAVMRQGTALDKDLHEFTATTSEAKWVFSQAVASYMHEEIFSKAIDVMRLKDELEGVGVGPERSANVKQQGEIKKALFAQIRVLDEKVSPYMNLAREV